MICAVCFADTLTLNGTERRTHPFVGGLFPRSNERMLNMYMGCLSCVVKRYLPAAISVLCLGQLPLRAGGDENVNALLDRVLTANKPWLDPSPIQGSYFIVSQTEGEGAAKRYGPFAMTKRGPWKTHSMNPGNQYAGRIGSLIWTPLHHLYYQTVPYAASIMETPIGTTLQPSKSKWSLSPPSKMKSGSPERMATWLRMPTTESNGREC